MVQRHPLRFRFLLALAILLVLLFLTHSWWLPWFGMALIRNEPPERADLAVVLAGDQYGFRIQKAAELVRHGFVPAVLVSGPVYFDTHECDQAIAYAVHRGSPADWFIPLPNTALSTRDEAAVVLAEMRRRKVHSFLLVTSDYHTARAGRIFRGAIREQGGGLTLHTVASDDRFFRPDSWWRDRQAQKIVVIEWAKTFATFLGK